MKSAKNMMAIGTEAPAGTGPEAMEDLMAVLPLSKVPALHEDVERLGGYLVQLGAIVGSMQRRMEELEAKQAAVTIRHDDVKRLQALIRMRADQICGKYNLQDKDSPRIFRAAIKRT